MNKLMHVLVCITVGFVIGVNFVLALNGSELAECARKNNVYACEFVAVPKQPDEAGK